MQITRQFFARFFMHVNHAFLFLDQILIQASVLNSHNGLPPDHIKHIAAIISKVAGIRMSIDHRAINIKSASQGKAIGGRAAPESDHPPQFRIVANILGKNRFAFIKNLLQNSFGGRKRHAHIRLCEAPRGTDAQVSAFE